jgi:quercetin dioxygenase-like cupin family protein
MTLLLALALLATAAEGNVVLDNPYARATRGAAPCASAATPGCRDRVVVALGPIELSQKGQARRMRRGDVAVFGPGESYRAPAGDFVEVAFKPDHPPVEAPSMRIPPQGNRVLYDGERFFVFEEMLPPGETRPRHSHGQRVVVVLNETELRQWPDGRPETVRPQVPDDVHFNPPVVHVVKTVGARPLRNIVIELKPEADTAARAQEKGGEDEFGPYEPVLNWPQPLPDHDGWTWGSVAGIYAETPDRIWIAQRGELPLPPDAKPFTPYGLLTPPRRAVGEDDSDGSRGWERRWHHCVFVVDRNGKLVQWWPQLDQLFAKKGGRGPHKIKMSPYDPQKHVWIFDDRMHQIFKFTYDGKLAMTLGESGVPGRDGNHFDRPTDIDWLPDGTFFVTDGYVGTRVAKFDKDGKFLMDWGRKPADPSHPRPYEFNTVHGVAVGKDRRVYVSDRGHSRIQVFDENGTFLDMWPNIRSPYHLLMSQDQHLWVADGVTQKILEYDLDGRLLYGWGVGGGWPGAFREVHQISVDQEGNLYVAEGSNGRAQKFQPKEGADPARLVGAELHWPAMHER